MAALVGSTLALLPDGMSRWFLPKLALAAVACLVAAFAPRVGRLPRTVWFVIAAGLGILVVAWAMAGGSPVDLMGRWPRYDGLVGLGVVSLVVVMAARILGPAAMPSVRGTLNVAVICASALLALVSSVEASGARPLASDLERPGALLGNASDQGLLAVAFAAFLVPLVATGSRRARLAAAVGIAAAVVTIAVSQSRGALVAFAVVCLVAAVVAIRSLSGRARGVAVVVALAGIAGTVAVAWGVAGGDARFLLPSDGDRTEIFRASLALIAAHPLGVGAGSFVDWIPAYLGPDWYAGNGAEVTLDSPHNLVLQVLAACGLLGAAWLVAAVGALVVLARRGRKSADATTRLRLDGAALALIGLAVGWMFTFTSPGTSIFGALCVGVLLARPTARPESATKIWIARGGITVAALLLCTWTAAEIPLNDAARAIAVGDIGQAQRDLDAARALRPWDPAIDDVATQSYARLAIDGDDSAIAPCIAAADRALAVTPMAQGLADAAAVCHLLNRDPATAITILQPVVDRAQSPTVSFRLALALLTVGERDAAMPLLENAARDGFPDARRLLEDVRAQR